MVVRRNVESVENLAVLEVLVSLDVQQLVLFAVGVDVVEKLSEGRVLDRSGALLDRHPVLGDPP